MASVQEIAAKTRGGSASKLIGAQPAPVAAPAPQLSAEDQKKITALQQIASSPGPAQATAQRLLQEAQQNPGAIRDPKWGQSLQQAILSYSLSQPEIQKQLGTDQPGLAKSAVGSFEGANAANLQSTERTIQTAASGKDVAQQILDNAKSQQADNRNFIDTNVTPLLNRQNNAAAAAGQLDLEALSQQTAARDRAKSKEEGLVNEARGLAQNYNSQSAQKFNEYEAGQNALNQQDQGNLSRYMGETDPLMTQLQARGSNPADVAAQQAALQRATGIAGGSLNYTAAQAASNAGDVARQNQSFNKLDAIGGGSLDYDAQLWASNPQDEQRQVDAYSNFDRIGGGKLDYVSEGGKAYANAEDLTNQRNAYRQIQDEVNSGGAKQNESYDLIKSRTGVEATAQEQLLYELARRQQASQEKSSRDAVGERMASQGLRSGAAAMAQARGASQQNSENALLSALAANAGAVQRSTQYTGMQADQANAMRSAQQNALGLQGNMSTNMRGQSFDEAYKRGTAKDVASANNQGTQLAGYQLAGNQANQIRQSNDTVGLTNAGYTNQARANNQSTRLTGNVQAGNMATSMRNASDNMSMFNTGQTNQAYQNNQATMFGGAQLQANQSNQIRSANDAMSQFQDTYASNEATRVGNLAGQRSAQNLATTGQVGARNDTTYGAGQNMLNTNYARDQDPIALDMGTVQPQYGRDSDVAAGTAAVGQNAFNRTTTQIGSATGVAGARSGQGSMDSQNLVAALKFGQGQRIDDDDRLALSRGY